MRRLWLILPAVALIGWGIRASVKGPTADPDPRARAKAAFERPDTIPFPRSNPFTEEKHYLGKLLFFDPRLSRSGTVSCATCHNPSFAWSDGLSRGVGDQHRALGRKTPTVLNVAWGWSFFWDGRAKNLEEQALGPIQSKEEMNLSLPELVARLRAIADYAPLFEKAFPGEPITPQAVAKAIATFERTVVSDLAPFDYWVAGDEAAISDAAKRGFDLFISKAACVKCHNGWNFTNGSFADTGLETQDLGRGRVQKEKDVFYTFKTPTLRNIARRAPYMHDGSLATLAEVIEHYDLGGRARRPSKTLFVKPLGLTPQEKSDLVSFLGTLTSQDEAVVVPLLPRGEGERKLWRGLSSSR